MRPFSKDKKMSYRPSDWKEYLKILKECSEGKKVEGTEYPPEICSCLIKIINNLRIGIQDSSFEEPRCMINMFPNHQIQIIPDCSGWSLASQTLHRQIWKFRGKRPLQVSAFPRRHQRAVANTLRRRTVRQHGLPKSKPGKGAGSLRGGSGTVLRVLGLVGYQPSLLE